MGSVYEDKNVNTTEWLDLDDKEYNNHFAYGQCYVAVEFNKLYEQGYSEQLRLPVYPEDITFNSSTSYASASILGRPGDISGYTGTSDITSSFSIVLHRELKIPGDISTDVNQIDRIISFIEAANYPKRLDSGMGIAVPIITYKFGDTIITGKQTSLNIKWDGPKIGNAYMKCTLTISVTHTPKNILYWNNIKNKNPRVFD